MALLFNLGLIKKKKGMVIGVSNCLFTQNVMVPLLQSLHESIKLIIKCT